MAGRKYEGKIAYLAFLQARSPRGMLPLQCPGGEGPEGRGQIPIGATERDGDE